jgi:hypothetical protein
LVEFIHLLDQSMRQRVTVSQTFQKHDWGKQSDRVSKESLHCTFFFKLTLLASSEGFDIRRRNPR